MGERFSSVRSEGKARSEIMDFLDKKRAYRKEEARSSCNLRDGKLLNVPLFYFGYFNILCCHILARGVDAWR